MKLNWKSQIEEMRASKGLSIADCSKKTKIPESFIESLEVGTFNLLPSEVYSKFHIKTYFNFLEIDPVDCLGAYNEYLKGLKEKPIDQQINISEVNIIYKIFNFISAKNLFPKIIAFVIFILILSFISFGRGNSDAKKLIEDNASFDQGLDVDLALIGQKTEENEIYINEKKEDEIIENISVKLNPIKESTIKIEVRGESWIVVKDKKDKNLLYELMQTGDYEIKAFDPLIFQIGNSSAVNLFVNDKKVNFSRAIKGKSNYAHFKFVEGKKIESIRD